MAAALGLYSSAPNVTVLHPLTGTSHQGQVEIAARADDGPNGSGVRRVEYQIDSTSGAWMPMHLDPTSTTYRGRWDASGVAQGEHALYLRAVDYTGNLRTVQVKVTVNPSEPSPIVMPGAEPTPERTADLLQPVVGGWAQDSIPRG